MGAFLGASVDVLHALFMVIWVLGLPLLFWHRFPRLTLAYAAYAVGFVVLNQLSELLLGECFLTSLARAAWQHAPRAGGPHVEPETWFTVRLAEAVFHMTPSHHGIKLASMVLIFVTALGVGFRGLVAFRARRAPNAIAPAAKTSL